MRKEILAFIILLTCVSVFAQNTILFDPAEHVLDVGGRRDKKQTSESAKLRWDIGAKRLMEAYVKHRPALLAFDDGVVLDIKVNSDGCSGLTGFGVRLIDANGEIFQYGKLKVPEGEGWKTIMVDLKNHHDIQSWGGDDAGRGEIDKPAHLMALVFVAPDNTITETCEVEVGTITRNAYDPARMAAEVTLSNINVSFDTGFRLHVVKVGKENESRFVLANPASGKEQTFDFVVDFTDMYGHKAQLKRPGITLKPGETNHIAIGKALPRTGWHHGTPKLILDGGKASCSKPSVTLAYIKPTGPRPHPPSDGFWFGFDARINDPAGHGYLAEAAAMIGGDYVRGGLTWPNIESNPPGSEGNGWAQHLDLLKMINSHGLGIHYGLSFTPAWAARQKYIDEYQANLNASGKRFSKEREQIFFQQGMSRTPPRSDAWRAFIKALLEKNKGHDVFAYEIWNEPDIGFWKGNTEEYLEILKIAGQEIMVASPDAYVFSGFAQFNHHGHNINPDLMKRSYIEMQDHYNAMGLHRHGHFAIFQSEVDGPLKEIRDGLRERKPLFFAETGYNVIGDRTHIDQAAGLVKKIAFARARGAVGVTWFGMMDNKFEEWNIIDPAHDAPRPAFCAHNELAALLRRKTKEAEHDAGKGNWIFSFSDDDETVFVGWNEDAPTDGQRALVVLPKGASAERIDLMGNSEPVMAHEGVISWALEKQPEYLRIKGGSAVIHGTLVSVSEEPYALPGVPVQLTCNLRNPLKRDAVYALNWTAPAGRHRKEDVPVAAGGIASATLEIPMPASKPGDPVPKVNLNYAIKDSPWSGDLSILLNSAATLISSKPISSRQPDFEIDTEKNIFNANENDPNRAEWTWKGPADLSFRLWLAADDEALKLKVDVSDERHMQSYDHAQMRKADSVQFGIHIPGREGAWELGLARHDNGAGLTYGWKAPAGLDVGYAASIKLSTELRKGGLVYTARLPYDGLGVDAALLRKKAIGFNLIVNDEDGGTREGFAFLAPGMGRGIDPKQWPILTFE